MIYVCECVAGTRPSFMLGAASTIEPHLSLLVIMHLSMHLPDPEITGEDQCLKYSIGKKC